jgi:quinol monooxygenase YgiN
MIIELAMLNCARTDMERLEEALNAVRPLFHAASGCRGVTLFKSSDRPGSYCLRVEWETLEHHLDEFLNSPALAEFERLVGPHLSAPPHITHYTKLYDDRIG